MPCTIALTARERKPLLHLYRHGADPQTARRAHILLLLDDGFPWAAIAAVLFTSPGTIARWQQRFLEGGVAAPAGRTPGRRPWFSWHWADVVVGWVTQRSPRDLGFLRSRWTCAVAAALLWPCLHL